MSAQNAQITSRSGKSEPLALTIKYWTLEERRKRSFKVAGLGLLLTIGFVFLPILHFVLVPMGVISTPLIASMVYKQILFVPIQSFACPECHQSISIPSLHKMSNLDLICDHCRQVLSLEWRSGG